MSAHPLSDWAEAAASPQPSTRPGAAVKAAVAEQPAERLVVQAGHRLAFQAMMASAGDEFGLIACRVNGVPSALIAMGRRIDTQRYEIMPLFVAICPGMRITDADGDVIWEHAA